jgi:hypothetical protein
MITASTFSSIRLMASCWSRIRSFSIQRMSGRHAVISAAKLATIAEIPAASIHHVKRRTSFSGSLLRGPTSTRIAPTMAPAMSCHSPDVTVPSVTAESMTRNTGVRSAIQNFQYFTSLFMFCSFCSGGNGPAGSGQPTRATNRTVPFPLGHYSTCPGFSAKRKFGLESGRESRQCDLPDDDAYDHSNPKVG